MAGSLTAGAVTLTTITDGTYTVTPAALSNGIVKAWVNFDGSGSVSTNQTIRSSYNVSSVYKNSTGNYTINFTNALTDTNYAVVGSTAFSGYSGAAAVGIVSEYTSGSSTYGTKTTTAVQIVSSDNNSDQFLDGYSLNCAIFR